MSGYGWNMPTVSNLLTGLAGDVAAALAKDTAAVTYVSLTPGSQPADDACQCGQLSIWCAGKNRTRNFPDDASGASTNCDDTEMMFDCRLRLVRCIPGWNPDTMAMPTAAEVTQAAVLQEQDGWVVWNTLVCALNDLKSLSVQLISDAMVTGQVPVGPGGQCAGTETSFRFALVPQCCPINATLA